jgi:hypothetical protein
MSLAKFERRLAAIASKLPRPAADPAIPPEVQWISHAAHSELDELALLAEAACYRELTESEQLRWIEIEAAAHRRQMDGWSDACGADRDKYAAIDLAAQPRWTGTEALPVPGRSR